MNSRVKNKRSTTLVELPKCPTGIKGLDEITAGGLPLGRPTLVCGSAGSGKTLMALEFVVRGAQDYDEPGVFMAFEERPEELAQNVTSLGFNVDALVKRGKLVIDYVHIDRSEIEETGEYDLEGLFLRLGLAIDTVGAKRVVLDTLEALFSGFSNHMILRAELRRLFRWLKDRGVTAIITAERGEGALTRHGLEEYVSDCVILLDNRVIDQVATRRLRIVKYRGSVHGTNEYPFLIDHDGFTVVPITSVALEHPAPAERVSSGVPELDRMLGGKGYFRGSDILVSGTAGTGKTSLGAHFVDAACRRGERALYLSFEESRDQVVRNMASIGIDLQQWFDKGLLDFYATRARMYGMEMHLALIHKRVTEFKPRVVVIDPVNSFIAIGTLEEAKAMLMRLVDFLKSKQITTVFNSLTGGGMQLEQTDMGISSLMDTWLLLRNMEISGERNRGLYVLKSRGMSHSNQIREFIITSHGIELREVYLGPGGVLTGSARMAQEAQERASELATTQHVERLRTALDQQRKMLETRIALMRAEFDAQEQEAVQSLAQDDVQERQKLSERSQIARRRGMGANGKGSQENSQAAKTRTGGKK